MCIITSVNIKQIAKCSPKQLYIISSVYFGDGENRICRYVKSVRSITEFIDIKSNQTIDVCRGHMKYVSLYN